MKIPSIRKDVSQSNPTLQDIIEALEILTGRRGRNARIDYGIVAGQPTDPIYIYELTRAINGLSSNIYYANAYSSFAEAVNAIGDRIASLVVSDEQFINTNIDVAALAPNTEVIVIGGGKFVGESGTTLNLGKYKGPDRQVFYGLTVTFNTDVTRIAYPRGGTYDSRVSSVTGAIVITLPQSWTDTMMMMYVDVYNYAAGTSFSLYCCGYNHISTTNWRSTSTHLSGNADPRNGVRFGHDGSKCCIVIGLTTSSWSYPKVSIRDFTGSHVNHAEHLWNNGWSITIKDNLSGYTFS